jgi:hypothetical protein
VSAISLLKNGLGAARKKLSKRKCEQLLSAAITELLKEHPDLTAAQARLTAAEATGADPDMQMLRARSMLSSAERFHDYTRPRGLRAAKKKSALPRRKKKTSKNRSRKKHAKVYPL